MTKGAKVRGGQCWRTETNLWDLILSPGRQGVSELGENFTHTWRTELQSEAAGY